MPLRARLARLERSAPRAAPNDWSDAARALSRVYGDGGEPAPGVDFPRLLRAALDRVYGPARRGPRPC